MKRRAFIQSAALATALCSAMTSGFSKAQASPVPYVRRDYSTLSQAEWAAFVAAVKHTNIATLGLVRPTKYDSFAFEFAHNFDSYQNYSANALSGLARYRRLLVDFEMALKSSDPGVSLPYWDFSVDWQAPQSSAIFTPTYLGGNGQGLLDSVVDGAFAPWQVGYPGLLNVLPLPHVLRRHFNSGPSIQSFASPQAISNIIAQSVTLNDLSSQLLGSAAPLVFDGIGGDMATTFSPNDPIFWLVMCYIDKLFSIWLQLHPTAPQPDPVTYTYV